MNLHKICKVLFIKVLITAIILTTLAQAEQSNWQKQEVDWRLSGGNRIKAIHYPTDKELPVLTKQDNLQKTKISRKIIQCDADRRIELFSQELTAPIYAVEIDSPPIGGFIPWIAVTATDSRSPELEFDAIPRSSIAGNFLTSNPRSDYGIGIFDTGASTHIMAGDTADSLGLFDHIPDLITSNFVTIAGVNSTVDVWVSQPLGIFVDGLSAIDPNDLTLNTSNMVGQTNVSIAVGDPSDSANIPTAIGSPLSAFFTTVINNERQITITRNDEEFTAPDISIYDSDDPDVPSYSNIVPLELRPLGALSVQYIPSLNNFFEFPPASPSTIIGNQSQSLFFVHSVDLKEGQRAAIDKSRFMLDTGAQVTVISTRVAARLELDIQNPGFLEEVVDVTGTSTMVPGFYIDSIEIPALGEWLSFRNVPVILFDVSSPEGGTLDGIIGMNLFGDFNLILRGGGLFLQEDPTLEFELIETEIPIVGDIAPQNGDGVVNFLDLTAFVAAWLTNSESLNWNPRADLAPQPLDGVVDFLDLAVFAGHWLESSIPVEMPE